MNILQLQSFIHVARTSNFHKSARELACSQAAVTKRIATLEQELGENLFMRSTRKVELTPFGKAYLAEIKPLLNKLEVAPMRAKERAANSESENTSKTARTPSKHKPIRKAQPSSRSTRKTNAKASAKPTEKTPVVQQQSEGSSAADMPPELL